jgi:iron(III) transport system permease protein
MAPSLSIPILAITLAISLFILINFLIIFFSAFVKTLIYDHSFTLEYLIGKNSLITLQNSFKMAGMAAIFGSIFSTCLSYVISRKSSAFTSTLEFVSLLGFCIPGTVIGIGYILFFNKLPFSIAPLLLMSLSTTFRNLAVGIEAGTSKLQQIDISMEEASFDLGAGKISTFLRILLPLMKSSFFVSFLFVFIEGMITVSAVIFLIAPGTNLSSLKILELVETGFINHACGVSVVLVVSVAICLSIINLLTGKTYRQ